MSFPEYFSIVCGDVVVRSRGDGYIARHAGKTASCTSSKEAAMDRVLAKVYGRAKTTLYYYRFITVTHSKGQWNDIYQAVAGKVAEARA